MNYIRFIPSFPDTGKNIEGMFYAEGSHIDAFKSPHKYQLDLTKELHYRQDIFSMQRNVMVTTGMQNILCLDIDQSGEKKKLTDLELEKIQKKLHDEAGLTPADYSINKTGYGFHLYLFFDEFFSVSENLWLKALVIKWSKTIKTDTLSLDSGSFNERRTMRFPGSYYIKKENENQSQFIFNEKLLSWESFKNKHHNLTDKVSINRDNTELKTIHLRKEIDWQAIMGPEGAEWSGCRFIRWNWVASKEVNYHEWLAQLTITSRFLKDRNLAYELVKKFNSNYEGFNEALFKSKFDEALDKMHPSSCEHISQIWRYANEKGKGCVDCPHRPLNQPLNIQAYPNKDTGFRKVSLNKKGELIPGEINFDSFFKYLRNEKKVFINEDESVWVLNKNHNFHEPKSKLYVNRHFKNLVSNIKTKEMGEIEFRMVRDYCFSTKEEEKKLLGKVIFKNGILDLKTGKLHSHDYINAINNYSLLFDYDPKATCPTYEELVDWAFTDKLERDFFFYYIVSALWTDISNETAMLLCGSGSNGKSSLMNGILYMYPKGAGAIMPFDLRALSRDESYLAFLNYSRISYCSDSDAKFLKNQTGLFKQIAGGEILSYRLKYAKSAITFKNNSKLIVGLNEVPEIVEGSFGLQRRLSVINFINKWPSDKKDLKYGDKLKKDAPGIFNFLYRYYMKFMENPVFPKLSQDYYKTARKMYDPAFDFFENYLEFDKEAESISYQFIYNHFLTYCEKESIPAYKIIQRRSFIYKLKKHCQEKISLGRTSQDRYIKGVKVRVEETEGDQTLQVGF